MSATQPGPKTFDQVFSKLPPLSRQLMSEVAVIALTNFVEFNIRTAIVLDQIIAKTGKLSDEVVGLFNDYLKQNLEKEFSSEDESCQLRLRFIESLALHEKSVTLDSLRVLHEALLPTFSPKYQIDSTDKMISSLSSLLMKENDRPENAKGVEQTIRFKDGRTYEGWIKGGKKNGKGKLTFPNGDVYSGDWVNGERHGQGDYTWKSGAKYSGQYAHNQRNGQGRFQYVDNKVYVGEWKDSLRSGKGTLTWENGDVYEGDFLKSNRTGKGVLRK
jgi:hypothetical protein